MVIRRGLSTQLFINNQVNPKLVIEEGCWYLCTDTAELFLGGIYEGKLDLKPINGKNISSSDPNLLSAIKELEKNLKDLEDIELFQRLDSEEDLKNIDTKSPDFNPNITYYIPVSDNKINTFIFDKGISEFICTNGVDTLTIKALVSESFNSLLAEGFLDSKIAEQLPNAIKDTIEHVVLHGGNA